MADKLIDDSLLGDTYRGWSIRWDYGYYSAFSPNYDASWEGEENGWVDNGERVQGRTRAECEQEVDNYIEEHANDKA